MAVARMEQRLSLLFSFCFAALQILSIVVIAQSPAAAPASAPAAPAPAAPPAAAPALVAPPPAAPALVAPGPAPPGPTNLTKILEKAGHFATLIRLLKITAVADQIYSQLNDTNNGMTVFAPSDRAFSSLKRGTLNGLTDDQKVRLLQFHVITNYIPMSQFDTVSNPVSTQAGGTGKYEFPLNVTTNGNSVNITTGINNASISDTVYTDGQLAIYEVDKVLLPLNIFGPHPPAPAPAPPKPKKQHRTAVALPPDASHATNVKLHALEQPSLTLLAAVIFGVFVGMID